MNTLIPRLTRALAALSVAALLPAAANAQEVIATFIGDTGTTLFGSPGVADTEIKRSGTASWRVSYTSDYATHGMAATGSNVTAASLTPYAGVGWFELYYRSSKAGTIRFIPVDAGHQFYTAETDRAVLATDEWTQLIIPFNGWTREPNSSELLRNFIIRGWGDMADAVVHYDDLKFVIPASDGQAHVSYASTPILIDGLIEDGYGADIQLIRTAEPETEAPAASNLSASWRSAFDADNLYLLIEVTDDVWVHSQTNSWHNDSVEIFFDGNNSKGTPALDSNDIKIAFVPKPGGAVDIVTGVFPPNPAGADFSGVQAASSMMSAGEYTGYRLEVKIPLSLLQITAEDGWEFGIDYQINDSDTNEASREELLTWFGTDLNNNVALYGTATLGAMPDVIPVTGVTLSHDTLSLATGTSGQLIATVQPSNATSAGISWTSSDDEVATVGPNGLVTGVGAGTATVTVTTDNGGFTDTVEVTVVQSSTFEDLVGGEPTDVEGLYLSDWFGYFYSFPEYNGWIWHYGLGWLYADSVLNTDDMWFWSTDFDNWVYTSETDFPYMWIMGEGWIYFGLSADGVGFQYDFNLDSWYQIAPLQHPYLFFTADDIPAIRERINHPAMTARRLRLISKVNTLLNQNPSTDSRTNQGNSGLLAFAYVITGDVRYAERAIEEALASAALSTWITGHSFNRGADLQSSERSIGAAMVYDWCYDVMTPEERATIRTALIEKGIKLYLLTMDPNLSENWWTTHQLNNWRGVGHGGGAIGALALYFESSHARQAARIANVHVPLALQAAILEDSGGHEGVGYNNYGVEYALQGLVALQRFFGDHEDVLRELADDRLGNYWDIYMHAPDLRVVNFGRHPDWNTGLFGQDSSVEGGPNSIRSALFDSIVPGGDQLLRWAGDNGGQRFYWEAAAPFYFLWRRDAPSMYQEDRPELQNVALFRGAGHAIWQEPDLFFAINGGGATHNRGDLGAFVLIANGERLIHLEPSLNFLGSEYQSTILVGGAGQNTGGPPPVGQYLRFGSGDDFHYLATRIDGQYGAGLTRAVRHAVMVRGEYLVLLDDLTASTSTKLEARFQSAHNVQINNGAGKVLGAQNDLHILTAGFDAFTFAQGTGGALKYLSLSRTAQDATLLTVLYPVAKGGAAPTVQVDGGSVTVTADGVTDTLVFEEVEGGWFLAEVNGADASDLKDYEDRNIVPYRDNRDDSEVPTWLLEVVR